MNDGEPGAAGAMSLSILIFVLLVVAWIATGAMSALVRLHRMQRDGVIGEDNAVPGGSLENHLREALVALSVAYLGASGGAAALLPRMLSDLGVASGPLSNIVAYTGLGAALLVGSVLAKGLALARPIGFARGVVGFVWVVHLALWPVTWALGMVVRRFAASLWALELSPPLSGQELRDILADDEAAMLMEGEEAGWARSIFELGDTELREIMVPRIDMVGLEVETSLEDAVRVAAEARYTRLPVWEGSQDRILGLVHAKDMLAALARDDEPTVRQLLRRVHFLPESKKIDDALREFRDGRVHLAVVVDEYGGTAGIVTLEDILEEIVGEIRDEFDQEGELVRVLDEKRAIIDPRIDIDDLNAMFSFELPTEESDTLGGLLYQLLGRVPERGATVEHGELMFTVDRVERQRIRQVTMASQTPLPRPEGAPSSSAESAG